MPRYGPPPTSDEPPASPPTERSSLTRWSPGRKALAVIASMGMVAAFVFNFLSPTSSGFKKKTTTTSSSTVSSTTSSSSTTSTTVVVGSTTVTIPAAGTPTTLAR